MAINRVGQTGGGLAGLHKVLDRPVGDHGVESACPLGAQVAIVEQANIEPSATTQCDLLRRDRDANSRRAATPNFLQQCAVAAADVENPRSGRAADFVQHVANLPELCHGQGRR